MSQRTASLLAGTAALATLSMVRIVAAYESGGWASAITTIITVCVLIPALVVGAWGVQWLLIRDRRRTAAQLRPGATVVLVGSARDVEFGLAKVAVLLTGDGVELLELPGGRWTRTLSFTDLAAVGISYTDSPIGWATELTLESADGPGWRIDLDGWRVFPRAVMRSKAERARAQIASAADLEVL